ncbi:hypothetical protein HMJ29_01210 [Hymenobacter taeanensis]|uniref:Uncharacterized protein n=1 Tax=Hymenobacter taeanensis TaxID=2735321 RepID=A0A6M6BEN8_9BACT|nr:MULTISPECIES: hypothetical protein [Hymenobacter]QJX45625.1 hypothetical protein HMJ29_01210 [Hymenobacter taeanensis]UOQ79460.1 hypothetical protein MUN83_11390 [Hymenobacter sp. 5414T-23]
MARWLRTSQAVLLASVPGKQLSVAAVMTVGNGQSLVKDLFDAGLQVCIKGESSDCSLGDIKNLECNPYAMEFVTANGCASPLPVQLVSFTARNQGGKV